MSTSSLTDCLSKINGQENGLSLNSCRIRCRAQQQLILRSRYRMYSLLIGDAKNDSIDNKYSIFSAAQVQGFG